MRNNIFKTIGAALVAVLVVAYIAVQAVNALSKYDTSMAVMHSVYDSKTCDAFIIRDEQIISGGTDGVIRYLLRDGERVAKNGTVAEIYVSEEAVYAREKYEELSARIDSLTESESQAKNSGTSLEIVNRQAYTKMLGMLQSFSDGDMTEVYSLSDEYLDLVNRRQIITGASSGYGGLIDQLKAELDEVGRTVAASQSSIKSVSSGYFIKNIDGYENTIPISELQNLTPKQLASVTPDGSLSQGAAGKIVGDYDWYVAVTMDNTEAMSLSIGQSVSVDFHLESLEPVPVTVKYMNRSDEGTVVIFSCSYMNSALAHARQVNIDIIFKEYKGLKIDTSAIRIENDVKGVYVDNGYMLKFKPVEVVYTGADFTLCKKSDDGSGLSLYDEVVTGGRNLYDGKIIS